VTSSEFFSKCTPTSIGSIAQTNLQLWQQLQSAGYSNDDLKTVNKAYKFAIALFSGRFRASGKTFIAHLTGTASILAHLNASSSIVAAGLLHAAYDFGDFGGWNRRGVTTSKQIGLRQEVGIEVESYVAAYSALIWNYRTIPKIFHLLPQWELKQRSVLLIRLANELEEYLDLGLLYCGKKIEIYGSHQTDMVSEMASNLGFPALASALTSAQEAMTNGCVLPELVNPTGVNNSSLIVPYSCQKKFLAWLSQSLITRLIKGGLDFPIFPSNLNQQ